MSCLCSFVHYILVNLLSLDFLPIPMTIYQLNERTHHHLSLARGIKPESDRASRDSCILQEIQKTGICWTALSKQSAKSRLHYKWAQVLQWINCKENRWRNYGLIEADKTNQVFWKGQNLSRISKDKIWGDKTMNMKKFKKVVTKSQDGDYSCEEEVHGGCFKWLANLNFLTWVVVTRCSSCNYLLSYVLCDFL